MIAQYVMASFILLIITIVFIDIIPKCSDWYKRIHMGRCKTQSQWNQLIIRKSLQWIGKTPKIKVTDNTRLIFLDMLKGNYSKDTIQYWQEASLLLGVGEYIKNSNDKIAKKSVEDFLKYKFDEQGQWRERPHNIDAAILAYALMKLDFIDFKQYKSALDYTENLIKQHIGEDGTVKYRKNMEQYRYVDTIGFICPFLVKYGAEFNKSECIELSIKQIEHYEQYGMLHKTMIPFHAYHIKNKLPLGLWGWGRGAGWFAIGVIDTWAELPNGNEYKSSLEKIIVRFADSILPYQQNNGSWTWSLLRSEATSDSSTTATFAWFMKNASNINGSSEAYVSASNKGMEYLKLVTRRNGEIDFSQGDTKDLGVYSTQFNILPFTQGFCVRTLNKEKEVNIHVEKAI
ncbi:hypothetical protein GLW00_03575 [Halobacillus litoralis]|uniref:Glycosyl hydrolase n=1 Tax=Halobacillus litoralis TaxID=45668 RepID=A0A845F7Z5_9BACI|nr:glycoside hydrolase family 88 protein [Halobacillus litoralis]MYL69914.1 hypothetical protein [Halobacillus litoralis]